MYESQEMVYANAVRPIVERLFRGLNVTILAYGQTGSGKTHTMGTNFTGTDDDDSGLIPRAIEQIFEHIDAHSDAYTFDVTCSFIELYQEHLYDLLSTLPRDQSIVDIREDYNRGVFVANLTEIPAERAGDAIDCLMKGSGGRAVGATAMNATSSRSHAIFTVNVRQTNRTNINDATTAKFHLVDLAGSERSNKTKATGTRFKEGVKINQGLLALGNVISALGSAQRNGTHVSYRDSKLTRLLQDSLGGNSVTLMIACVSPADYNADETISTLRYADRAKQIRNKPIVNQDPKTAEILRLRSVVDKLRLELLQRDNPEAQTPSNTTMRSVLKRASQEDGRFDDSALNDTFVVGSPQRRTLKRLSGIPSAEEMARLRNERTTLMTQNIQLQGALNKTLSQLSNVNVNFSSQEQMVDRMSEGLLEIRKQIGELCGDSGTETDSLVDFVEQLQRRVRDVNYTIDVLHQEIRENRNRHQNIDSNNEDDLEIATDCQEEQIKYNDELLAVQHEIDIKMHVSRMLLKNQEEHAKLALNAPQIDYEERLTGLQAELADAQRAVEELKRIGGGKADRATAKISEERRKRVKDLETALQDLKLKSKKQQDLLHLQKSYKDQLAKQQNELVELKRKRVDLTNKVNRINKENQQVKSASARDRVQFESKMRRQEMEKKKIQATADREKVVMQRKLDASIATNNRLKIANEKHASSQALRKRTNNGAHKEEQIQAWVDHEIEVIYSVVDAKHSLQQLIDDRAQMNGRLIKLRQRSKSDGTLTEDVKQQMAQLSEEIEMRNVQIAEMQERISDTNLEQKINIVTDGLSSMPEARMAVRYLFGSLSDLRVEFDNTAARLQDMRIEGEELAVRRRAEAANDERQLHELRSQCAHLRDEKLAVERSYEDKVALLLSEFSKRAGDPNGAVDGKPSDGYDANEWTHRIHSELVDTMRAKIEDYESRIVELQRTKRKARKNARYSDYSLDVDEEEADDDNETSPWHSDDAEHDPDWQKTPAAKDRKRQVLREKVSDHTESMCIKNKAKL